MSSTPAGAGSGSSPRLQVSVDQSIHPHEEVLNSPTIGHPVTSANGTNTANHSRVTSDTTVDGSVGSRPNSLHGSSSGSSTLSESSLGGLNHVNDGVGGSTTQRRMSRVYTSQDDLLRHRVPGTQEESPSQAVVPVVRFRALSSGSVGVDEGVLVPEKESSWKRWLRRRVPMYGWLISPGYKLSDLPDDLIAGVTISTVVIPQSMAYAMLAPLPPVYGLYTSVVPILIYCIFGTSRHMHTGTFAITTLLLGQAVRGLLAQSSPSGTLDNYSLVDALLYDTRPSVNAFARESDPEYERRFIGMILMLSFVIGLVQIFMSFLRVGGWASKHLLPDALVGGFNTAAVFHIGTSQLKHFLGMKNVPSNQGAFALLKSWAWFVANFTQETNWYTVFLGSGAIVFMIIMRKLERKRKAAYELKQKIKERLLLQQRQAVSALLVREHEERQEQQRQQQLKRDASLRTAQDNTPGHAGPSISFAPEARTPSDAEQGVITATEIIAEDRQIYVPIPDILLAVIVLTVVNVIFSLDTPRSEGGWGINVIGTIPKGLPVIAFPPNLISSGPKEWMTLEFVKTVLLPMVQPALLISVIIYVMSFSIAKQFGKRYGYKVDANQEMFALGVASMGGSIFSGYACTGSLTRTAILAQSGGKTPLASIVGVVTVTLTLICLTWCFERVPNAVLAAIVLVALQSLVMQITEPLKLWRLGQRKAAIIWSVTFISVFIISVELGIAIGIAVVLLTTAYSWIVSRCYGEDEPLIADGRRRHSSNRRASHGEAGDSLLNNGSRNNYGSAAESGSQPKGHGDGRLSADASPSDWKTRMMRTKWGGRIGGFFGLDKPIFSDPQRGNNEDH